MRCQECGPWSRRADLKWLPKGNYGFWKAAVQAPCEENGLVDGVIMWQATGVEGGHDDRVPLGTKILAAQVCADWQSARRLPTCPTSFHLSGTNPAAFSSSRL